MGASTAFPMALSQMSAPLPLLLAALAMSASLFGAPARAQVESFLWGPGSNVGPATKVEPKNCRTAADGTVTCDTQLVNPEGTTPAKPQYNPFKF